MSPSYRSDLTDAQWELLSGVIPAAKPGGRPRSVNMRAVENAIFYILCAGCTWHLLPHDVPKWKTVYHYFRQWHLEGDWQRIHEQLRSLGTSERTAPSSAHQRQSSIVSQWKLPL